MTKFARLSREIDHLQSQKNDLVAIINSLSAPIELIPKPGPIVSHHLALPPSGPAGSVPPLLPLAPAFHNYAFATNIEHKLPIQAPPMASGSNVRLPAMQWSDDTSDEDDEDEMSGSLPGDYMGPTAASLGGYGPDFDQDGNFHGRGRDTFAGPQANADE